MESITNLIVRRPYGSAGDAGGGLTIALNAHGDVVPPGEGWTQDPYGAAIEDGKLYGRAAAVSKSDFATFTYAVRALEAVARPSKGAVELHFTYDEEFGGILGPGWLLANNLTQPDLMVRSEEHTSELQSPCNLVCRLLLEKKKSYSITRTRSLTCAIRPVCVPLCTCQYGSPSLESCRRNVRRSVFLLTHYIMHSTLHRYPD